MMAPRWISSLLGGLKQTSDKPHALKGNEAKALDVDMQIPWVSATSYWNPNLETGTEWQGQLLDLHEGLRDAHSATCLDLRCQIAASLEYQFHAQEGTSPQAMDLVKSVFDDLDIPEILEQMTKSSYYGLTIHEIFWDRRADGKMVPWDLQAIDLMYIFFDQARNLYINGAKPPLGKTMLRRTGAHFRNPYGLGRGRTVPQWVRVKKAIAYTLFRDFPLYSHDRIHFTYPGGTDDMRVKEYQVVCKNVLEGTALITGDDLKTMPIPLNSKFEVGDQLLQASDTQIARAILGNTLQTGEGRHGTQALGKVHADMGEKQMWADGIRNEHTLNKTLIPWIVEANLPGDVPPRISFDVEAKPELIQQIQSLIGFSMFKSPDGKPLAVSTDWMRDRFNIPAPDPENDEDAATLDPSIQPASPKPPMPPTLSAKDPQGYEEMLDRWGGQWRSRLTGPHRQILAALEDLK